MLPQVHNLNGLILAGGLSKRMGRDKSEIYFHDQPQYLYLQKLLSNYCDAVFLSRRKDQKILPSENIIIDQYEMEGPINGILTALVKYPLSNWLVVACDMPMIDDHILSYLIANRNKEKVATCFWDSDLKNPDPMVAIWERKAGGLLADFYQHGQISPRKFLMQNEIELLKAPTKENLLNINTPEEYSQLKERLKIR